METQQNLPQPQGDLLTVAEAAQFFKVQVSTIRSWILQRRIPYVKPGGKLIRFRRVDLEKILAARTVKARA